MIDARNNVRELTSFDGDSSRLSAALEEYQRRAERDGAQDILAFAHEFPDIEDDLRACLANLQQIRELGDAFSSAVDFAQDAVIAEHAGRMSAGRQVDLAERRGWC